MEKPEKVTGSDGSVYDSINAFLRVHGGHRNGIRIKLSRPGGLVKGGVTYRIGTERPENPVQYIEDPLLATLRKRYTEAELKQIANGQGIAKNTVIYPEIHLKGNHHKMLVISDTHIGSIYSPKEWHSIVAEFAVREGVECVLHCGDLVDGLKIGRAGTQMYELSDIGFDAQLRASIECFRQYSVPVYIISGNHDMYFGEFAGANIVDAFAHALPNVKYIGHNSADIDIDGVIIRLFHGTDGNSYALSYRLQKICEAITGGNKPNILLAGHVHKFAYIFERNIHAISVPCMQRQTKFMEGKKLAAHTGFLELEFDVHEGSVCNLSCKLFPFFA